MDKNTRTMLLVIIVCLAMGTTLFIILGASSAPSSGDLALQTVTEEYTEIYEKVKDITCVDSPTQEISTQVTKAKSGLWMLTGDICLLEGEAIDSNTLLTSVEGVNLITFVCDGSSVCDGADTTLQVMSNSILSTKGTSKFRLFVACKNGSEGYSCELTLKAASSA